MGGIVIVMETGAAYVRLDEALYDAAQSALLAHDQRSNTSMQVLLLVMYGVSSYWTARIRSFETNHSGPSGANSATGGC